MAYIGQLQYNINLGNNKFITSEEFKNKETDKIEFNEKNLIEYMKANVGIKNDDIKVIIRKLGIQAPPGSLWIIQEEGEENTDKKIYIGSTGIYEVDNVKIANIKFKAQDLLKKDITAEYIALDNALRGFQKAEIDRALDKTITDDNVEKYITTQQSFYDEFLIANENYDKAFKGLYWSNGIQNPENIIIDFVLEEINDTQEKKEVN